MRRFRLGTLFTLVATAALLVPASTALADRGGHGGHGGGGGGGGGGGDHSSRSFSGGGGGGGSSFRSFNGGGDGGSSFRSFNGGGGGSSSRSFNFDGGSRSSSMRSFNMGDGGSRSSSSSSSRSFNFGDSSPRVFSGSGNSNRSGGDNDGGNSANVFRALQSQSDRGNFRPAPRTFSNNNGDGGNSSGGDSTAKSFRNGSQGKFQQGNDRGNVDRSQLEAFLNNKDGDRSSRFGSSKSNDNDSHDSGTRQTVYGQQLGANAKGDNKNFRNYQAGRPSDEQVRNFLNLRDQRGNGNGAGSDNNGGQTGKNFTANRGQFGNRSNDGRGDASKLGDKLSTDGGKKFTAAAKPFERDGKDAKNFGKDDKDSFKGPGSKGPGGFGDGKNNAIGKDFNRDGRGDRDGRGRDFNQGDDFHGSDGAKAEFANWKNVWKGKNGDGHDHRDWSGKWKNGDRIDIANSIRGDWHGRRDHDNFPFCGNWWRGGRHHGWGFWNDYAVFRHRPWFWWGWASCPILTDWCGFGWSTPYYWDYGPGEYIYCNNGVVYVNGAWYQPAPIYYQQTVQLVEKAPVLAQEAAAQVEWLPLGVFAVTPDGLKEPSVMVQLAVTKDGIIGGTAFDQKAGASYTIQGTVDKNTQRAVWSYEDANKKRILMETSVNNLTQNESTGLVHYSPNDMRVVELVRLQEPNGQAGELPAPPQAQQPQLAAPQPVPPQLPPQQ